MRIYKGRIKELMAELEELDKNIPIEKDGEYETTVSLNNVIRKINSINWSLNKNYRIYPSFDKKR